tara:strand:- start:7 stop:672 length:666 start_codon:yes stop_codon:yes gene_type:complete
MIPNIPREYAQFLSLSFMAGGIALFACDDVVGGCVAVGVACWVMLISESVLLTKIQNQMRASLDDLNRKREREVSDLLNFLRDAQINQTPFDSMEGAKRLCEHIDSPSMVLTAHHQIVKANKIMHKTLGWKSNSLNGLAAHYINDPSVMSKIGEIMARPENLKRKSMVTQYVYLHKSGEKICGQMDAYEISTAGSLEGYFVVFHPSAESMISSEELLELIN